VYNNFGHIPDKVLKTKFLSLFVSNVMGGCQFGVDTRNFISVSQENILKHTNDGVIQLGHIQYGLPDHRALLFKYLADYIELPTKLVKGSNENSVMWNVIILNGLDYVVDLFFKPMDMYRDDSMEGQVYKLHMTNLNEELSSKQIGTQLSQNNNEVNTIHSYRWMNPIDFSQTNKIQKLQQLGKGGSGAVWKCKLDGFTFATKVFYIADSMSRKHRLRIENEIKVLHKLVTCPNVVKYLGYEKKLMNFLFLWNMYRIPCFKLYSISNTKIEKCFKFQKLSTVLCKY